MSRSTNSPLDWFQHDPLLRHEFASLKIELDFIAARKPLSLLSVTSAGRREGRTTTALQLGAAYARAGKTAIVLDADLRNPSLHRALSGKPDYGLADALLYGLYGDGLVQPASEPNLHIIAAGTKVAHATELLASERFDALLAELRRQADIVVIDAPPASPFIDAKLIGAKCDGVLFVAPHGKVKRADAQRVRDDLAAVGARLIGAVIIQAKRSRAMRSG